MKTPAATCWAPSTPNSSPNLKSPRLSILQQQKIAELYLLAKKETALLRQLSAEKERYYDLLIRNVHSTMK